MANKMNKADRQAFEHFLKMYKGQWDLNDYARKEYDENLEYYHGYRDSHAYPLAYNNSYNKLLPRIYTVLARFMEQLYQGGPNDLVGVRPRKRSDVERAPRVKGLLQYQLETLNCVDAPGSSFLFNFGWMFNAVTFGKGICKLYWRKEERIAPQKIYLPVPIVRNGAVVGLDTVGTTIEAPQIVYDGPYAEVLHNKLFVPHPHYKHIQKMPGVFCVYKRSLDYLKKMEDKGIYRNLKLLGWDSPTASREAAGKYASDSDEAIATSLDIHKALSYQEMSSDRYTDMVDVIEGYGRYIFPEDESPYEVGSGVKIKGRESEAIVHLGNYKVLLSLQKNKYGFRPFFDMDAYADPELFWGKGVIHLGKELQESYNVLANTRLQNALMSVNQMLKVRMDADIDPESLVWKPFGLVPVEEMTDVEPLVIPDMSQTGVFREQEEFFESTISDITGMYPYGMGQTPPRQEHVGTIYSLQAMGEARTKLLLMTMDYQGFQPFMKYMMLLNTWHLPDKFETRINTNQGQQFTPLFPGDIHPDYDFTVRYTAMEPALGKQFRAQQLLQLSNLWAESPYLQHYEWMKAIMEVMDLHDTDRYLKTPQQLQQEQQQALQTQVLMQAGQALTQDMLASAQAKRELQRDMVKGLLK